ncbi:MAG TPA: type II toxin-antitoxin system VapC family toxin [Rhizobiaceae bacterium]|nr:type II toxin-antitoxin system VapC family toxin [Rhizobiaceae bacterium]
MALVVDSSIAACWSLPDEASEVANRALARVVDETMLVPRLFWYEIRNVLIVSERRRRISIGQTNEALARITLLPIEIDEIPSTEKAMELARLYALSFYDASYLELALRTKSTLATLDRKLRAGARAAKVHLIGSD